MTLNLAQNRGEPSVWDRRDREIDLERWLVALTAGGLLLAAARGRPFGRLLLAAGGVALASWAAAGPEMRRERRRQIGTVWPLRRRDDDAVTEALEESFPASDPPALTPSAADARGAKRSRAGQRNAASSEAELHDRPSRRSEAKPR